MLTNKLRQLPSVDALLDSQPATDLMRLYGRENTVNALRHVLDDTRQQLLSGTDISITDDAFLKIATQQLENRFLPTLRPVINATGVIIHTNLGRAVLSKSAQDAVQQMASNYSNLEFTLETGKRGSRYLHAEQALTEITGAEAALVINNCAAALVLALSALAQGSDVVISRSQLVEIGGGFRIPDIMAQSGAHLVEVGTTNRTRLADYESAITDQTALLLRVHSSNFRIVGFIEQTELTDMADLAHAHQLLCVDDLGSGALLDTADYGLSHEPQVQASIAAGADLVLFSGDKLLGGPQAGIMIGKADVIARLKKHPLARAMRADKLAYAALSATLDHYRRGDAVNEIPVWRMISTPVEDLRQRVETWVQKLSTGDIITGESTVGGGSLPGTTLPTVLLALHPESANDFATQLRMATPMPIVPRISDDRVLFDPRTILPHQDDLFLQTLKALL
ncbi:MAG: L-seryl-tRNA(Sec) selenium transferase [Chloroflexota bacterium]